MKVKNDNVLHLGNVSFQVLESLNLVLVVGLAVDYVVHLAEGYSRSEHKDRLGRTRDALQEVSESTFRHIWGIYNFFNSVHQNYNVRLIIML